MSALVLASDNAGADGAAERLTGSELLATVFLLVMAGFDTTVNLIASGTLALLTCPGRRTGCGRSRRCCLSGVVRFNVPLTSPERPVHHRRARQLATW